LEPIVPSARRRDDQGMNSPAHIDEHASDLLSAAQAIQGAAGRPGSSRAATATLACLEDALQALSASWYQIAADAGVLERRREARLAQPWPAAEKGLSREQEVRLIETLHEVAAAFAQCARACREAQPTLVPLIDERLSAERPSGEPARFERQMPPTRRVA
jgi:hypothetical protein